MQLEIHALEGGIYLAKLSDGDHGEKWLRSVCKKHGVIYKANMRFHNLSHVKEFFEPLAPEDVSLIHNCAYDEMIGSPEIGGTYSQSLYWYKNLDAGADGERIPSIA